MTSNRLAARMTYCSAALLAALLALWGPAPSSAGSQRAYILATASTGGTYYPVGVALSTLTKVKLQPTHKLSLSAINSAGSGENIRLLRENEAQFAILQGLYGAHAKNGTGPVAADGPQKNLRAITMLWQNVEQFVIRADAAKSGTISDIKALKGRTLALGKKNSGTIGSNRYLLSNLGLDIGKDFSLFHGGYGPSAAAMQDGKAAGMNTPAGVPTGAITKLFATLPGKVRVLSFTAEQAEKADGGAGLWTPYTIPNGTYPGQNSDVNTIAQPNFLAVRADIPDEDVYLLTKTIYENLPFLNAIHKATKAMALKKAITGLPLPLHPGAVRYFKEMNIDIPAAMLAVE